MCVLLVLDRMFYRYLSSLYGLMSHLRIMFSYWFLHLDALSIDISALLKSPSIIVSLSLFFFISISVNICFIYLDAPMLGSYMFTAVFVLFLDQPFHHYVISFFIVWFKIYFIWYEYCCTDFIFVFLFTWNIFFHFFILSLFVSLTLKWVSCKQHIDEVFFIHSPNLCLSIGAFSSCTLKVIL